MTWTPGALLKLPTERFLLRTMTREDVTDTYLGWMADPGVMVGLNLPRRKLSRLQAVQYVLSHDNRTKLTRAAARLQYRTGSAAVRGTNSP